MSFAQHVNTAVTFQLLKVLRLISRTISIIVRTAYLIFSGRLSLLITLQKSLQMKLIQKKKTQLNIQNDYPYIDQGYFRDYYYFLFDDTRTLYEKRMFISNSLRDSLYKNSPHYLPDYYIDRILKQIE